MYFRLPLPSPHRFSYFCGCINPGNPNPGKNWAQNNLNILTQYSAHFRFSLCLKFLPEGSLKSPPHGEYHTRENPFPSMAVFETNLTFIEAVVVFMAGGIWRPQNRPRGSHPSNKKRDINIELLNRNVQNFAIKITRISLLLGEQLDIIVTAIGRLLDVKSSIEHEIDHVARNGPGNWEFVSGV